MSEEPNHQTLSTKPLRIGLDEKQKKTVSVAGTRQFDSSEENAAYCVRFFEEDLAPDLEHIAPYMRQAFADFRAIKQGSGVTIMGCSTQQEWSQRYFHRTAQAIRLWFEDPETHERRLENRRKKSLPLSQSFPTTAEVTEVIAPTVVPTPEVEVSDLIPVEPEPTPEPTKSAEPEFSSSYIQRILAENAELKQQESDWKKLVASICTRAHVRDYLEHLLPIYDRLMGT